MSSEEEDPRPGSKKQRLQGACDVCRRKKIRCDSAKMPGNRCSNCIAFSFNCTHMAKKRFTESYVSGLEQQVRKMEVLFKKFLPDMDVKQDRELETTPSNNSSPSSSKSDSPAHALVADILASPMTFPFPENRAAIRQSFTDLAQYARSLEVELATCKESSGAQDELTVSPPNSPSTFTPASDSGPVYIGTDDDPVTNLDSNDYVSAALSKQMIHLSLESAHLRYVGQSSGLSLVKAAMDLKKEWAGEAPLCRPTLPFKRPMYWSIRPWELDIAPKPVPYVFPDNDLLQDLACLYFENVNPYMPILHRPSFEKAVSEDLHIHDRLFAATVLLVCAVASRYSNDPRVLLEGAESEEHSCGWKYFVQILRMRVALSFTDPPSVYRLQMYCLATVYLQGCSTTLACWTMVGRGIRYAQEVGANRRHVGPLTAEKELWKRSFWLLVCFDKNMSASKGRPCATTDEDFDLDLPVECDDEYWEDPDPQKAFKQPPGKPSKVAYFNAMIKVTAILGFALRTIYTIKKPKHASGSEWEQHVMSELDSALNKWIDSVPDHLRWDPLRENGLFFDQSVSLYTIYYHIQMQVHRPFITLRGDSSNTPLSFSSLAMCTNAARSCIHTLDAYYKRRSVPLPYVNMSLFMAGIVLLLHTWGCTRYGISTTDHTKDLLDVQKCMDMLKVAEKRWHAPGRLWDIMNDLSTTGNLHFPDAIRASNKRERFADQPRPSNPIQAPIPATQATDIREEQSIFTQNAPIIFNRPAHIPDNTVDMLGAGLSAPAIDHSWYTSFPLNTASTETTITSHTHNMPPFHAFSQQTDAQSIYPHSGVSSNAIESSQNLGGSPEFTFRAPNVFDDSMSLWFNPPEGIELGDWGVYIESLSELAQGSNLPGDFS